MQPSSFNTRQISAAENNEKHKTRMLNLVSKPYPSSSDTNLIDFHNDNSQKPHKNDNDKQIADYQLKMLEEFCKTTTLTRQHNELEEAEFRLFFDKYEHSTKDKTTLNHEELRVFEQTVDSNHKFVNKPCSFDSSNFNIQDTVVHRDLELGNEETKLNEDLIDEIIFEQHLEKQLSNSKTSGINEIKTKLLETPRTLNTFADPKIVEKSILDEIINKNKVQYYKTEPLFGSDNSSLNTKLKNPINSENDEDYSNKMKTKLDQKALTEELVTKYDVKYLEAIKKIEKIFQKRSVLKSDTEKAKLTPGPTLYEKTVILPQMMQRLIARNNGLGNEGVSLKLILDAGSMPYHIKQSTSNSLPNMQVVHPKKDKITSQPRPIPDDVKTKCSSLLYQSSEKIRSVADIYNRQNIKDAFKQPGSSSSSQSVATTTKSDLHNQSKKNKDTFVFDSMKDALKTSVSEDLLDDITVLKPPEVLMSDCNRQRLIAFETGKLFNNFVRGGTYNAP